MVCAECKFCQRTQGNKMDKMDWVCIEELHRVPVGTPVCVSQIDLNKEACKRFKERYDED